MRPVRPWEIVPTLRFFAMLPLAMCVAILATEVIARATLDPLKPRPVWLLAAGTGLIHILAVVLVLPLLRAHHFTWRDAFGPCRPRRLRVWLFAAACTLPAMAAAWMLHEGCGRVLELLSIPHDNQAAVEAVRNAGRGWERVLLFGFAALSAPVVEEIVFRGILWPVARERGWGARGAVGVGLFFALIHFNIAALVPLCFLGVFWIWLYERTGDLSAPILSHALFNAANFAWILLADPSTGSTP